MGLSLSRATAVKPSPDKAVMADPMDPPVPPPRHHVANESESGQNGNSNSLADKLDKLSPTDEDLATAEQVISAHMADLDFEEDLYGDDDHPFGYTTRNTHPTANMSNGNNGIGGNPEIQVVKRSILPSRRRKLMNLRYLTRLRGLVKFAQTIWAIMLYTVIQFDGDYYIYAVQKVVCHACPYLIGVNLFIMNGYTAFPHLTIKDVATRNGMLFTELITCACFTAIFMCAAPLRALELIFVKFSLESLFMTVFFQGPLTILLLYDLFGCFGEWSLVGMRPLGQRVAPLATDLPPGGKNPNAGKGIDNGGFIAAGPKRPLNNNNNVLPDV
uniref:Ion_trans domain-containing protein n=1 Tax=Panagrellus redivivus TaxID=6233 RepID=A0A7E4V2L0_PANRE